VSISGSGAGPERILAELASATTGGDPVILATIVSTEGSVPRHAGTKMVIRPDGSILGTIGGGKVEDAVRRDALAALKQDQPSLHQYTLQDPDLGDPGVCGGNMTVYLEPYMPAHTVYVIGSGHVGRAVVELAHWLGYRTVIVDDRDELVTEEALPHADVRFAGSVADALVAHPVTKDTSVVVVTRSHELDAQIAPLLVGTPAGYVGVMGSRRRWNATRAALDEGPGVSNDALDRIHNPIGFDIGAETVEEIAVSIMSEIIAFNAGAGE
jgi:xanthine dehydrogenase accessory factor